ncbi:MAG: ATP-binding protein, partial [Candidatus Dormibacteria bacterium]
GESEVCASFRAVRRAKLARVLRFYADKARRHADDSNGTGLSPEAYSDLLAEIDRLIEKGGDYSFATAERVDRGWIFCPEYMGAKPLDITPAGWDTQVFLFGPDFDFRRSSSGDASSGAPVAPIPGKREPDKAGTAFLSEANESFAAVPNSSTRPDSATGPEDQLRDRARNEILKRVPTICLGTNLQTGAEVLWPLTIKGNPHLLVAGLPGMGKTTCLLNLCRQMLSADVRPIVFSYHQDIDEKLQQTVGSIRFIDFNGLGFNPLQVMDRKSRMAYLDVAGAVRDIFVAIFPELGDVQGERIRKALKDSFIEYGCDDPSSELRQLREPPFSRFVEILRSEPKPDRGLKTLLSRLEELDDYGFFQPSDAQASLWESECPIVLRIHSTQNDNLQKAFASLVFYGLYKDMFRRGTQDRITHCLIFDEAHRAARLQLIPTMAKECRKYGISLILASQEARDFHVSLFSAIANYLVLRLTEADAKALARNIATSDQERMLIDRIKQMERFRAFYCSEGLKKPVPVALKA